MSGEVLLRPIKRDLRQLGLPATDRLARRIRQAHITSAGKRIPTVDLTGLHLPSWVTPKLLGSLGMGGTSSKFPSLESQGPEAAYTVLSEALAAVRAYEGWHFSRISELRKIASGLAKIGKTEEACVALKEALESAKLETSFGRFDAMFDIATDLIRLEKPDQAIDPLLDGIAAIATARFNENKREASLRKAFTTLEEIGKIDRAPEAADRIEDIEKKPLTARCLAEALTAFEKAPLAFESLMKAFQAAELIKNHITRTEEFQKIANGLLQLGKSKEAEEALNKALEAALFLSDMDSVAPRTRSYHMCGIASALVLVGKKSHQPRPLQEALRVLGYIEHMRGWGQSYSEIRFEIASAYVDQRQFEDAYNMIQESLKDARAGFYLYNPPAFLGAYGIFKFLIKISDLLLRMDKAEEAFAVVREAMEDARTNPPDPFYKSDKLHTISRVLIELKDFEGANKIAREAYEAAQGIDIGNGKAHRLNNIALLYNSLGQTRKAHQIVQEAYDIAVKTESPGARADKLLEIAQTLAQLDQPLSN